MGRNIPLTLHDDRFNLHPVPKCSTLHDTIQSKTDFQKQTTRDLDDFLLKKDSVQVDYEIENKNKVFMR